MVTIRNSRRSWRPDLARYSGSRYLAIVTALTADIRSGRLQVGDRLPPQRQLAATLGFHLATVNRAFAEAGRRGLVRAVQGQGTFVAELRAGAELEPFVDLTINVPPEAHGFDLPGRLEAAVQRLFAGEGATTMLRYPELGGSEPDRAAGAQWLSRRGVRIQASHLVATHGADHAILLGLQVLAGPERRTVLVEQLSYPGFRAAAATLGLRVIAVPCDAEGPDPEALAREARQRPCVCCLTPVIHNPTGRSYSPARLEALTALAYRENIRFLEDDAYGLLAQDAPEPLAMRLPEHALYLTSFSKTFAPGLRLGYLGAVGEGMAARIGEAARATTQTPAPLSSGVARLWIEDGSADLVLDAVRRQIDARHVIAEEVLGAYLAKAERGSPHRWLELPGGLKRGDFVDRAKRAGVGVRASDAFTAAGLPPEAVRLSLCAAPDLHALRRALRTLARLIDDPHQHPHAVM